LGSIEEGSTMANTSLHPAASPTAQRRSSGAGRPASGEFLRGPLLTLLAAALLLGAGSARAQQAQGQEEDQNLVQAAGDQPGADEPPPPPLPSGETQWAGDDTSAYGQEVAPEGEGEGEGDAYTQGYEDGKQDALADQTHGPTMDDFHASLDQSGQWQQTAEYGTVWCPRVDPTWRPYTMGSWVYTSYGWTWVSTEPWGWAAFHYGRWVQLGSVWAWMPGRVWAPAWVAWRWGGGYAGWSPLGPRGAIYWHSNGWWTVVEQRHFLHPIHSVMVPQDRHAGIFGNAHPVRPIFGRVGGPTRTWVGGAVGHTITPIRVETVNHPGQAHSLGGGILHVYAPQTRPIARPAQPSTGVGRAAGQSNTPRWMPRPGWGGKPGNATPPIRNDGSRQGNTNHGTWPHGQPGSGGPRVQPGGGAPRTQPGSGQPHTQPGTPPAPHTSPGPRAQPQGNPPPHENRGVPVQAHPITPGGNPTHFGGVAIHPGGGQQQPHAQPAPQHRPAPTPPVVHPPKAEHHEKKDK
jgi:hypothetical protein